MASAANKLHRGDEPLAFVIERDDPIDVGRDVAVLAVGFDGVEVVTDELGVEHDLFPRFVGFPNEC